jgi:transcriptional regulator GlxA family with amidase domain
MSVKHYKGHASFRAPLRVGFLGFDGINALDLVGPMEAFATPAFDGESGHPPRPCYEVLVVGVRKEPFRAESGLVFEPTVDLQAAPPLDTLIIPGGSGLRRPETTAAAAAWIRSRAGRVRRIASVCTGIYGLAATGLLDGRRVTTHWRFARPVQQAFPRLRVDANALFLKDGPFYTSAGITAGIDLALALIEEDHGGPVALGVARELVMYLKRPGGQEQYSEPLRFQIESGERFTDLAAWIHAHLEHDLSVRSLADRAHLCPRHFSRAFKQALGATPGTFVENLRLDEARRRLSAPTAAVGAVGASVGFRSADAFRRAFLRRFGVTPSAYRGRFGASRGRPAGLGLL